MFKNRGDYYTGKYKTQVTGHRSQVKENLMKKVRHSVKLLMFICLLYFLLSHNQAYVWHGPYAFQFCSERKQLNGESFTLYWNLKSPLVRKAGDLDTRFCLRSTPRDSEQGSERGMELKNSKQHGGREQFRGKKTALADKLF